MRLHFHDAFVETQHPRGQPKNKGEFAKGHGATAPAAKPTAKPAAAIPISQTHHEAVKHMHGMGINPSQVKVHNTSVPTTFNGKPYNVIGEVHPQTGAAIYTNTGQVGRTVSEEKLRGSFSRNEQGVFHQPVKDIDELYNKAKEDEPDFKKDVQATAAQVGGEAVFTPPEFAEPGTILKSRKSAERKLHDADINGDASKLLDVLRGTIACKTIKDTRTAALNFVQQHSGQILKVKDRIVNPAPGGYRDILINYKTAGGVVAELQFNAEAMIETKLGVGHRIYELTRQLEWHPKWHHHERMLQVLKEKSAEAYATAYKESGNGNWAV